MYEPSPVLHPQTSALVPCHCGGCCRIIRYPRLIVLHRIRHAAIDAYRPCSTMLHLIQNPQSLTVLPKSGAKRAFLLRTVSGTVDDLRRHCAARVGVAFGIGDCDLRTQSTRSEDSTPSNPEHPSSMLRGGCVSSNDATGLVPHPLSSPGEGPK